jgi:hypothetical protein
MGHRRGDSGDCSPAGHAVSIVALFNEAINAGNVAALAELMTDTHRFIDSAGTTVEDKVASLGFGPMLDQRSALYVAKLAMLVLDVGEADVDQVGTSPRLHGPDANADRAHA